MNEPPREPRPGGAPPPPAYGPPPTAPGGTPPGARPPGPPAAPSREASREPADRLAVHLVWEGVLLVVAIGLVAAILATTPARNFLSVLYQAGYVGLAASALAFSLRTATPNLAVGPIAGLTGGLAALLVTENLPPAVAMAAAVAIAVVVGAVLGGLVAALSVPAWAATLAAGALMSSALLGMSGGRVLIAGRLGEGFPDAVWVGLFVVISIGGGLLWLLPGVRRALSATRHPGDPGVWGGGRAALGALVGIAGSSLLAGLAGIAQLMRIQAASPAAGQSLTLIALAAVLLGGASIYGRRAGVAGTVLGVAIVVMGENLLIINAVPSWVTQLFVGTVVVVGLGVTRLTESLQPR